MQGLSLAEVGGASSQSHGSSDDRHTREYQNVEFVSEGSSKNHTRLVKLTNTKIYNTANDKDQNLITGLNAIVMRSIGKETEESMKQVRANKFFYCRGWTHLEGRLQDSNPSTLGILLALRGYFISIRPAQGDKLLLKFNTATSAFLQPMLAPEFLKIYEPNRTGDKYLMALELLRGAKVRIVYDSTGRDGKSDPNVEDSRIKTITEIVVHRNSVGSLNIQRYVLRDGKTKKTVLSCYEGWWQC